MSLKPRKDDNLSARERASQGFASLLKACALLAVSPLLFLWAFWPYVLPWILAGLLYQYLLRLK